MFKKINIYIIVLFQLFIIPTQVQATWPTVDIMDAPKTAIEMIKDNVANGMTQWKDSTLQNGSNAAMQSVKNCLDFDISALVGDLMGVDIELPCGAVWSIDNPADQIAQRIVDDMKSAFIKRPLDLFIGYLQQFLNIDNYYCGFSATSNFSDIYNYEDLLKASKRRLDSKYDCEKESAKGPMDWNLENDLTSKREKERAENGKSGAVPSIQQNNNEIKQITDLTQEYLMASDTVNRQKRILRRVAYTNEYADLLDYKDALTSEEFKNLETNKNFDTKPKLEGEVELQNLFNDKTIVISTESQLKDAHILKVKREYLQYTTMPFPIINYSKYGGESQGGGSQPTGIFDEKWAMEGTLPSLTLKWVSPFEIFKEFEIVNRKKYDEPTIKNYLFDDLATQYQIQKINDGKDKGKSFHDVFLKGIYSDFTPIANQTVDDKGDVASFEEKWRLALFTTLLKNQNGQVLPNRFTHSSAMKFLIESTELIAGEIQNFGSTNGNAMLVNVYLKSNLYSQAIIVDVLEKQLINYIQVNDTDRATPLFQNKTEMYLDAIYKLLAKDGIDQGTKNAMDMLKK